MGHTIQRRKLHYCECGTLVAEEYVEEKAIVYTVAVKEFNDQNKCLVCGNVVKVKLER